MNLLYEFLQKITDIPEGSFLKLQKIAELKNVPANTLLINLGEVPSKYFFLQNGVIRSFYSSESGKTYNRRIYTSYTFAAPIIDFLKKEPSRLTFETLTESTLFETRFDSFFALCNEDKYIDKLYSKILEQHIIKYEEHYRDIILLNATERYLKLRKQIPNIDQLIPQYQIASYINVTPVQLSRIRKSLR